MDHFFLLLDGLCLAGQAVMHLRFTCRLTGRRASAGCIAAYGALLWGIQLAFSRLLSGGELAIGAGVLALYGVGRLLLKNPEPVSWLAAVLSFYISQLSFGVVNSAEAVLFPRYLGTPLLYLLVLLALVLSFALSQGCYAAVLQLLPLGEGERTPCLSLLLLPGLFCFAAELYILRTAYAVVLLSPGELGRHGGLCLLQLLGLGALLCTLYAFRRLCQGLRAQAELGAMRVYLEEARARYERTRSFRHDLKNHLSVLDGLLREGRLEEGRAYLEKLEAVSHALSLPCRTGHPVVDILLEEKLGLARDILAEISLVLPSPCGIDDLDLCIIFANALDNAIAACRTGDSVPFLRVSGRRQGDFFLLTFENSCAGGPRPPEGIGLANLRAAAEKYGGTVLAEQSGRRFSLQVLLNIS